MAFEGVPHVFDSNAELAVSSRHSLRISSWTATSSIRERTRHSRVEVAHVGVARVQAAQGRARTGLGSNNEREEETNDYRDGKFLGSAAGAALVLGTSSPALPSESCNPAIRQLR